MDKAEQPARLVLASHNAKKTEELRAILAPSGVELVNLSAFPGAPVPEENGGTFEENAVLKARSARDFTGLAAVADDSGLEVDALNGEPGVRSARFAGDDADDTENNLLLLRKLAGMPAGMRKARFVSVIALARPDGAFATFRGETNGVILENARGDEGFGYDPLFLSDDLGMTFAEVAAEEKNRVSHRGRAVAKLVAALRREAL